MSNFFFSDQSYAFEPVIKDLDQTIVENDLKVFRKKILEVIHEQIKQKDLSRSEVALATRNSSSVIGPIIKGNIDRVSTDRLLRIARRLGLKPKVKFDIEGKSKN